LLELGTLSAESIMRSILEKIHHLNPTMNAFIAMHTDEALLEMARQADVRIRMGRKKGPLDGIPVAIKDNLITSDFPTTCASKMLKRKHIIS
jgi:aspartyl-tRNA(Asn)/glutamyl-tRNA(Gln) amidotransferase subunit A